MLIQPTFAYYNLTCMYIYGNKHYYYYILSVLSPDSAFHSALLHSFIDNTLNMSTAVIGSYGDRGMTPVIIPQS